MCKYQRADGVQWSHCPIPVISKHEACLLWCLEGEKKGDTEVCLFVAAVENMAEQRDNLWKRAPLTM